MVRRCPRGGLAPCGRRPTCAPRKSGAGAVGPRGPERQDSRAAQGAARVVRRGAARPGERRRRYSRGRQRELRRLHRGGKPAWPARLPGNRARPPAGHW